MSDQNIYDNPFGPLKSDQVTPEQYRRAYETLNEVTDLDVSRILVLSSLSANFSLTGDDLQTLILGGGEIQATKDSHFGMGGGLPLFADELEEAGIEITREWIEWNIYLF